MALCQMIPGATAMQVAAYVGLRVRGARGAVVSYADESRDKLSCCIKTIHYATVRMDTNFQPPHGLRQTNQLVCRQISGMIKELLADQ